MGYLASLVIARLFILKEKTLRLVIMGLGLEILAICLLKAGYSSGISSVLLGLGLGLIMPEFLVMFVKLSHHCQRVQPIQLICWLVKPALHLELLLRAIWIRIPIKCFT